MNRRVEFWKRRWNLRNCETPQNA